MSTWKCLNMRCQWSGSYEDGFVPYKRPDLLICPDCGDKTLEEGEAYDNALAIWTNRWYSLQALLNEQDDKPQAGQHRHGVDQAPEGEGTHE